MKTQIKLATKWGEESRIVKPALPTESIHIFKGGTSGYKLSVGQRSLTLPELTAVLQLANRAIARQRKKAEQDA